jgi:hypothetical protein
MALGLDEHHFSSSVIQRVVSATARFGSFADATDALRLAGINISESQVRRLAHEVGQEMIQIRDQKAIEHRHRQLKPRTEVIPQAVVVEVDGGRIRTRQAGQSPGVHDAANKEDKVACLATLSGPSFTADPCPEPPQSFQCPRRVQRLVTQIKGDSGEAGAQEIPGESTDPLPEPSRADRPCRWSPQRLVMTCVASMETSASFGPLMAAEASERNFYQSLRRAFVADGSAYNWSIHRGYFGDFEPITDFLHAVCYVYSCAAAVSVDEAGGWSQYLSWMRALWQGRVAEVLSELDTWQERLGEPPEPDELSEPSRDPRCVVHRGRSYLRNNASRMAYPRYRQEGLPTTSSLVESLVGEVNARVKSKQKYWTRGEGSESILQLRAAYLSQDDRLSRFFANRPGCAFRKRRRGHNTTKPLALQTAA